MDLCDKHHVPVLVHTNFHPAEPLLFLAMAKAYPRVPVILGHMGMRIVSDAVIAAEQASNIYLETSSNMPAYIKRTVKRLGAARMLFGTDAPYNMPQTRSTGCGRWICRRATWSASRVRTYLVSSGDGRDDL